MGLGLALAGATLASGAMGFAGSQSQEKAASDAAKAAWWADKMRRQRLKRQLGGYAEAGDEALDSYMQTLSGGDELQAMLESDPRYQFQRDQGMQAIEGSAAARGNLRSGSTLKDIMRFSQGLASDSITQRQNALMPMLNMGFQTRQMFSGVDPNVASTAINAQLAQGAGAMQRAQIGSDTLGGLVNAGMIGGSGMSLRDLLGGGGSAGATAFGGGQMMPGVAGYA